MGKTQFKNSKNQGKNGKKSFNKDKSKGKPKTNNNNNEDDQEVEDLLAWGNQRQNYYKDDESQYSSLSEQEEQANKIYQNKYDELNLNDQQLYGIEDEDHSSNKLSEQNLDDQQQEEQQGISQEYIIEELQWALQKAKTIHLYEQSSTITISYQKLLQNYILAMISIKQLKIPYIQHHPILEMIVQIKRKINMLQKKLTLKKEIIVKNDSKNNIKNDQDLSEQEEGDYDGQEEEYFQQEQEQDEISQEQNQNNKQSPLASQDYEADYCQQATQKQKIQHKKGMEYYNQLKKQSQVEKKQKKIQKKQQFIQKTKSKPIFKQISQTQGRFASQLILKNKGLIKKRKKIQGNSRVKLRKKYQKKIALRRAQTGHFIRQNPGRQYQGQSNIKYGKIAGVKLK